MVNKHYQKHKERLQKQARERYQTLSEEKKDKRQEKAREIYQNLTEEEKKRLRYYQERKKNLPQYRRNYHLTHKK